MFNHCQGLPDGPCPKGRCNASVRNSICDLFLCPDCNNARFPPKVSCQLSFQPKADKEQVQVTHEETPQPQQISIDKTPVVNELLYFVSNGIDGTPVSDKLKTVIIDFYREDEILSAKNALIQNIADLKALGVSAFTKKRIGDNKAKASGDDIFGIFEAANSKNMFES